MGLRPSRGELTAASAGAAGLTPAPPKNKAASPTGAATGRTVDVPGVVPEGSGGKPPVRWTTPGRFSVDAGPVPHCSGLSSVAAAPPSASAPPPIWRSSCLMMAWLSPPGRPVIWLANWVSSISVPILVPEFSSMPEDSVDWRMLFISSCMNRASNCLAAVCTAAFGSRPALARRASMLRTSPARPAYTNAWPTRC